jgi:hypothetical protein
VVRPLAAQKDYGARTESADIFERRVREVASHGVAHIKRGDRVAVTTTAGERVISDRARGIDPILRFLALVQQVDEPPAKLPSVLMAKSKDTEAA